MSQMRTRKRPAPGASPLESTTQQNMSSLGGTSNTEWQSQDTGAAYPDQLFGDNNFASNSPTQPSQATNQIARRPPNQPVVPLSNFGQSGSSSWQVAEAPKNFEGDDSWSLGYDDLDQKAALAKKDAEAKRKQIPPFVQKLSSFLDESRNTDLIRWSDDGDSFIVVDEDEFAKTLIPELFKHNNYASFVRQLNMYGFHKKVGLSDNSMRASERKNKTPSEYSNPFFKRGRPNLLWLIQKPKTAGTKASTKGGLKSRSDDFDDETDGNVGREASPITPSIDQFHDGSNYRAGRPNLLTGGDGVASTIPQDQLASVQRELVNIRDNQSRISQMLKEVRREHQQLFGQAKYFHDLHEKHDNSINAILSFLASVYQKNIGGAPSSIGDMFSSAIPSAEQQTGNVVEVGDERDKFQQAQPIRRGPLLLEDAKRSPASPDASSTPTSQGRRVSRENRSSQHTSINRDRPSPAVQELSDNTPSARSSASPQINPEQPTEEHGQMPQVDIMSMLNNATAQNNSSFTPNAPMDFSEALSHVQNSAASMSPDERHNMLQLMSNEYQSPQDATNIRNAIPYSTGSTQVAPSQVNSDALAASQTLYDQRTQDLDQIGRIIREQSNNINNLSNTLTPLSPSGSIPGINGSDANYYPGPSGPLGTGENQNPDLFDLDNIFNSDSYFGDGTAGGGGTESEGLPGFDFGAASLDDFTNDQVKDTSGEANDNEDGNNDGDANSPANTVETVTGDESNNDGDEGYEISAPSPGKRRRVR